MSQNQCIKYIDKILWTLHNRLLHDHSGHTSKWMIPSERKIFSKISQKRLIFYDCKSQPAITYLKLTIEALEQGLKYVQS